MARMTPSSSSSLSSRSAMVGATGATMMTKNEPLTTIRR